MSTDDFDPTKRRPSDRVAGLAREVGRRAEELLAERARTRSEPAAISPGGGDDALHQLSRRSEDEMEALWRAAGLDPQSDDGDAARLSSRSRTAVLPRTTVPTEDAPVPSAQGGQRILLEGVAKRYPGTDKPAVDDVTLEIPAGEIVMLVGPSGCGKTTLLKMINRLIEPTSGRVIIGEEDVTHKDPDDLRRRVGYVIQGAGLFPHYTVGDNIALVPRLLGWDKSRISSRVDELLDLVGLEPSTFRDRYPRQLSGGQQQRIGVARALAADPPVLLMDEPFGAVDPITRQRLQDELLRLQEELKKTIVFVTHDFDEAVKLGDRIAILQVGSEIVQYDTPEAILSNPANEFVEGFVGHGAALKQLTLTRVRDVDLHEAAVATVGGDAAAAAQRARELGREWVIVLDDQERPQRWVDVRDLETRPGFLQEVSRNLDLEVVNTASTLQDALDEMLTSSHGVVVVTGRRNRYEGVVRVETVMEAMQNLQSAANRTSTHPRGEDISYEWSERL